MAKVKVIARIRPFLPGDQRDDVLQTEGSVISIRDPRNPGQRIHYNEFAACYGTTSPNQGAPRSIFDTEVIPLLDDVYNGNIIAIICYGATSAGKSTTMFGNGQTVGIIYEAVAYLLQHPERLSSDFIYQLQFMEVYCDDCYDLLATKGRQQRLTIRETKEERVTILGLGVHEFSSLEEFKRLTDSAVKARRKAPTVANDRSSRSHAIFKLSIHDAASGHLKGIIEFVDLAGSERPEHVPKSQKQESSSINKSLSALSGVITSLNEGSKHIPYRNNTLTRVLKNALAGKSQTLLVCHLAPGAKWIKQTRATIEFATKAKSVKASNNPLLEKQAENKYERLCRTDPEASILFDVYFQRKVEDAVTKQVNNIVQEQSPMKLATLANTICGGPQETKLGVSHDTVPEDQPTSKEHNPTEAWPMDNHSPIDIEIVQQEVIPNIQEDRIECIPQKHVPSIQAAETTTEQPLYNVQLEDVVLSETICEEQLPNSESNCLEPIDIPAEEPFTGEAISNEQSPQGAPPVMLGTPLQQQAEQASNEGSTSTPDPEKDRYRKRLNKGLEAKHEKYSKSGKKIDRGKFARACVIAGKMALDERDDVEFAISMFEKAISWYPENERLLEETLNLKKRLREEKGIILPPRKKDSRSAARPLVSNRNGNTRIAKPSSGGRRAISNDAPISKPRKNGSPLRSRSKGKARPALMAAAEAFADSDVDVVSQSPDESADEVERSLLIEEIHETPPAPCIGKRKRELNRQKKTSNGRTKKRKSEDSDDIIYPQVEPATSRPKRFKRPLF
ncbi:P-loop containing nucleoside triphosphate hydrolase protein [Serendipita vermifera]|nr:P-loop containing nucleoside triphosphate hydrolase protein [Serendipita vermifera]